MNKLIFDLDRLNLNAYTCKRIATNVFKNKEVNIYYAIKANNSEKVLSRIFDAGIGAEVLSLNEMNKVENEIPIIINGHYKDNELIETFINRKNAVLNIEGLQELNILVELLKKYPESICNIGITILNNDNSRIGLPFSKLNEVKKIIKSNDQIKLTSLHYHAGWNKTDNKEILSIINRMTEYNEWLSNNEININCWNLGGSFAEPTAFPKQLYNRLKMISNYIPKSINTIHLEPGRYFVGDCGSFSTKILEIRDQEYIISGSTYGYLLSGATPSISWCNKIGTKKKLNLCDYQDKKSILSGIWPSENDLIALNELYTFNLGDKIIFNNMGGYLGQDINTLTLDEKLNYDYISYLDVFKIDYCKQMNFFIKYWNFNTKKFDNIPKKTYDRCYFFKIFSKLFKPEKKYMESEVNRIISKYYHDYSLIRRELVELGYLRRTIEETVIYEKK